MKIEENKEGVNNDLYYDLETKEIEDKLDFIKIGLTETRKKIEKFLIGRGEVITRRGDKFNSSSPIVDYLKGLKVMMIHLKDKEKAVDEMKKNPL